MIAGMTDMQSVQVPGSVAEVHSPVAEGHGPVAEVPASLPAARSGEIAAGLRLSVAAGMGMVPIGVAFGVLVVQSGLPWWVAPGLSIALFAGSVELLLVGLMVTAIALTVLLVNSRHEFYAFSFPLRVVRHPLARFYSVYALIDEAYAVTAARPGTWTARRLIALQLAFHSYWVGGGLIGVLLASLIPGRVEGLEFALCALFITLTLDACRSRREVPSLLLAALSLVLARVLVPQAALFVALLGFMALLLLRFVLTRRRPVSEELDRA